MAHVITWQRGDGKVLYQPAVDDERLWGEDPRSSRLSFYEWSRNGRVPRFKGPFGDEGPPLQLEPKLYRWKWRALRVARSEEKRRAKAALAEVHEVEDS